MHQYDHPTGVSVRPTAGAVRTVGWMTDGNSATGVKGSIAYVDWFNDLQANLLAILTAGGVTPTKGASGDNDLLNAINFLAKSRWPVSSHSGNVTAVAADLLRVFSFTAAATLALPSASTAGNGWACRVVNAGTDTNVVIDPSGSQTLDGLTTRTLSSGSRVTIVCDGTAWHTMQGRWLWDSGELAITAASGATLSHSLSKKPTRTWPVLRCVGAEHGHSSGDEVEFNPAGGNASNAGLVLTPAASTVKYRIGSAGLQIPNATTGVTATLTAANWRLIIRAEEVF